MGVDVDAVSVSGELPIPPLSSLETRFVYRSLTYLPTAWFDRYLVPIWLLSSVTSSVIQRHRLASRIAGWSLYPSAHSHQPVRAGCCMCVLFDTSIWPRACHGRPTKSIAEFFQKCCCFGVLFSERRWLSDMTIAGFSVAEYIHTYPPALILLNILGRKSVQTQDEHGTGPRLISVTCIRLSYISRSFLRPPTPIDAAGRKGHV